MSVVSPEHDLAYDERVNPLLWLVQTKYVGASFDVATDDETLLSYLGDGPPSKKAIKSFGHDQATGVHFLLTRGGTAVHTDKAYTRYSHQLVLRNDGNRLRGMPRYDSDDPADWHPQLLPGVMYCLDTHSPHQGLPDDRVSAAERGKGLKAVIAVDRNAPLDPADALALCETYLDKQMADFPFDPKARFERWKDPGLGG